MAFHSALAKASHNTLASLINDVIVRLNTDVFVETIRDYTPEQLREINLRIYNTHYAIMEAVLAHDPDGADRAVGGHGPAVSGYGPLNRHGASQVRQRAAKRNARRCA